MLTFARSILVKHQLSIAANPFISRTFEDILMIANIGVGMLIVLLLCPMRFIRKLSKMFLVLWERWTIMC